ncbi:hypothetical protein [Leeia aquatica]|uniref:Uncharacterized protein n=1 Tax=Leeia aquatica TaxID=2725557 RepID=A0A847S333_9NEIS|nr:hypothetical protein [Leeia aquatica]NLR76201.1 hypothetical protein [Leeia aquatica]
MNTQSTEQIHLPKARLMIKPLAITVALLALQPSWIMAATPLATRIELALRCKADPLDAQDPATRKWLRQQGVQFINHDPEGPPDQVFRFKSPITIAGVRIKTLYYQADSGGIFMAEFDGDATQLAQSLRLKPHTGSNQQRREDGYGLLDARFIDHTAGPGVMQQVVGPLTANPKRYGWACHFHDG